MPLTPTDVANKQFKVAFRGYSLDEVDAFLDEVESELTRLLRDNNSLRTGGGAERGPVGTDLSKPAASPAKAEQTAGPTPGGPAPARSAPAGAPADPQPAAVQDAPTKALRMLQLAQQTADQFHAEAQAEADTLSESARAEAAATLQAARAEADALRAEAVAHRGAAGSEAAAALAAARDEAQRTLADARSAAEARLVSAGAEAEQLEAAVRESRQAAEAELAEQRAAAVGELDGHRERLETQIQELRSFEQDYRSRLRDYFSGQLRHLDGANEGDGPAHAVPTRQGANGQPGTP